MTLLPKARRGFRERFRKQKTANSRKVNYSWEKKKSAVFPFNLCMVLFLSSSVPFTLFSPLQCLLSPTPNLHLTASSAAGIQSGLFPLHSLFFAAVQEEDKRKNVLNFKRTLAQGSCEKKTWTKQFKGKSYSVPAHIFGAQTKTCTSVLGVKIKDVRHKQCTEIGKSTNTEVHRLLYPHPYQEGIG